jgi:SOS-response transcriptional repressor LexA
MTSMTKLDGIGKGITRKQGLTPKQAKFLKVLRDFIEQNGYSPSYEEMKQMNDMKSKSNVHEYIKNLEKRGYLTYEKYCNRTITLI